jgi:spermidine/putrescine transport system ATP-binding protein
MPEFAVELRDVSKRFPGPSGEIVTAVNNVTMQIKDGEFFSMLGPSGCGKTTSLRMIAGFELPTDGEIYVHDKPMGQTPPYKRPINTVFQNYALFPHMTIGENVGFGMEMKGVNKAERAERVKRALEMVRLPGFEKRRTRQMSGGQQQRVALARALVNRPEVLLLDEPLGALDLKLRKEMQLELKRLQREVGITFVYVTHDQEEALTMSDRIAVMSGGKVLQIGPASEIYERPNCKFVADFIGETCFLDGTVIGQNGRQVDVLLEGGLIAHAQSDAQLNKSQQVTVAVRPEKFGIRPFDSAANIYAGRVEDVVYIGTDTHYAVRLAGNQLVRVREQNDDPYSRPIANAGDEVKVYCDEAAARVLVE